MGPGTALAASGDRLWVARYNGHANSSDFGTSLAVSPDGATVFVTGCSAGKTTGCDYATVAYGATSGNVLWATRYNGPGNDNDQANSLVISPNGTTVFVTGQSRGLNSSEDYATVAYDATSGNLLWVARYNGPQNDSDVPRSIAVSPDAALVFVTGVSPAPTSASDYTTIAYDAATGRRQWLARYNGRGYSYDAAKSLVVAPDGGTVFVTGHSGPSVSWDYATVAYEAASGSKLWVARYDGPAHSTDEASSLAVSPDGAMVFVTGDIGSTTSVDYATVAYDAGSGHKLWVARYNGSVDSLDVAVSLGVSPDGAKVFVTGSSVGQTRTDDYATVAYDAATGHKLWVARYDGPGNYFDEPSSLAVSPDGASLFVTGKSEPSLPCPFATCFDYATVAYDAASGDRLWVARYNGPGNGPDEATFVAVSPDAAGVFVTGSASGFSTGSTAPIDIATIAYQA